MPKHSSKAYCDNRVGMEVRTVQCQFNSSIPTILDDYACEHFKERPISQRPCLLQCPQDCIMTEFGPWSTCDKKQITNRTRTRSVVVMASFGGKDCPDLAEIEPCHNNSSIYSQSYVKSFYSVNEWGNCKPLKGKKKHLYKKYSRYVGLQSRNVKCMQGDYKGNAIR